MEILDFMCATDETAIYPGDMPAQADSGFAGLMYVALKLNGEAGEVAEQIGKALRDDEGRITATRLINLKKEIGDVFWYLARLCRDLNLDPREILDINYQKLQRRKAEGKIQGSGSDR